MSVYASILSRRLIAFAALLVMSSWLTLQVWTPVHLVSHDHFGAEPPWLLIAKGVDRGQKDDHHNHGLRPDHSHEKNEGDQERESPTGHQPHSITDHLLLADIASQQAPQEIETVALESLPDSEENEYVASEEFITARGRGPPC